MTDWRDLPEGMVFAVLTFRVENSFAWRVHLYRKETALDYKGHQVVQKTEIGSDFAATLWGAKRMARKLYRRYLKRRKLGDGHTILMVLGKS